MVKFWIVLYEAEMWKSPFALPALCVKHPYSVIYKAALSFRVIKI